MMNNASLTSLFDKAGGRYALAALTQKRASAILKGAPPLVERPKGTSPFHIALAELDLEKISLEPALQKKERTST